MTIPKTLKVGGLIYDVEIADAIDDQECAAFIDIQKLKIKVEKASPAAMEHNFLHEIIHAINSEIPEETTEYLAMLLYQVIQDNPEVFKGGEQKNDKHRK